MSTIFNVFFSFFFAGCKIKALRAKTNTYIKTPVRGEEPVFIVTGRREDVEMAKREIVLGGRALLHDPRLTLQSRRKWPRINRLSSRPSQPPGTDHHPGACSLPRRGPSGGTQRSHDQTHPAADAHLHCDAQPRERPCIRGHRHARGMWIVHERRSNAHHSAHRRIR